ncbi:MAG: hypothetical protein AUJ28_01590 [Parcubacteria group bacterium CG1_02_37_51]|nr:MAG: hypothetical protein AUJ28_01590 [Parcubacteria group bacterium CG1_02_37_51]
MHISKIKSLREKYPTFVYNSYHWEIKDHVFEAGWDFVSGDIQYHPQLIIHLDQDVTQQNQVSLDSLVFHLGLAEIFSYWKATISPQIIIKAGQLSPEQISWWEKLHLHGMGQFFYENDIVDFVNSFHWTSNSTIQHSDLPSFTPNDTNLVLLGGGKDSVVTAQLLKEHQQPIVGFSLNSTPAVSRISQDLSLKVITATRTIDPSLIVLNQIGYLNGHVPFSAYLAFTGTLVAYLYGLKSVIVSNEASAEEENVVYQDFKINHQYSKTLNFEQDFQHYFTKYLSPNIEYFSFLRPLYELQIAGIFSRYPQFFSSFRSCNVGQKTDTWCGNCAKCLSIYLLLGSFLSLSTMQSLFGQNVLDNPTLLPIFKAMIEVGQTRPFECIGTRNETIISTNLILQKCSGELPILIEYFKQDFLTSNPQNLNVSSHALLNHFGVHSMPGIFETILKQALPIELQ